MTPLKNVTVLITGASSGIGQACAEAFANKGARLIVAARRSDRIRQLAKKLERKHHVDVHWVKLDVRDRVRVRQAIEGLPKIWRAIDILVNNAGLSRGLEKIHEADLRDWEEMIDTNVKGLLYVTRAVMPGMIARNRGHIVNIGSVAGHEVYPGGSVYCATKHSVKALNKAMRLDAFGTDVRVTGVDPGLVETEFSLVRFHGDRERAGRVYQGMRPLSAGDVACAVVWACERPGHVNIENMIIMPTGQASAGMVNRTQQ
ncbi:MAG: SDR family oxidoreductase [Candidatus Edwardsbacteria bacterium]|nr:SDR family oxidoreductase [Candidatus Edwardsbacteria bacterium]